MRILLRRFPITIRFMICLFLSSLFSTQALATKAGCQSIDTFDKIVGGVCWECIFPLRVSCITLDEGDGYRPSGAFGGSPVCSCQEKGDPVPKIGLTTSFWSPEKLIEFQRQAGCSGVLNTNFPATSVSTSVDIVPSVNQLT